MGTTTIFVFPYPDPPYIVANYPSLGQQLAEDVEDAIAARTILQIVRATDTTQRTTTSASFVDVTGLSVTITPSATTNKVILIGIVLALNAGANYSYYQITDSSNVAITGAESMRAGTGAAGTAVFPTTFIAYASPGTVSATTYKVRFMSENGGSTSAFNNTNTGQIYAIEVAA